MACAPRRTRRLATQLAACLAAALFWLPLHTIAAEPARSIAVIYPDVGEPFRGVFAKIIEGVEERVRGRVTSLPVSATASAQEIGEELRRRDVRVLIALGRQGLKLAAALDPSLDVVVGCVVSVPETQVRGAVHTLAPDPALLFARLRQLMPGARRVWVVYDPRQNEWLMRLAREAAKAQGLELATQAAPDLAAASRLYQQALATADPKRDVLWLPQDSTTVDDGTVLPLVLKQAWERNLAVFSSNVTHAKRGALFALYPDNLEMGRALAASALHHLSSGRPQADVVLPLREVRAAINTRTAAHLGLSLGAGSGTFDLVFPEP
jgi:putative ABC transport system substrate-binding protein